MIYVDSSVLLAAIFGEDRAPPDAFWSANLVASRLLEYEVWTSVHALGLASLAADVANALALVNLVELTPGTLERAAAVPGPAPNP